jgi:glucose/arabinose dehydrogenase
MRARAVVAAGLLLGVLASGCGGDDSSGGATTTTASQPVNRGNEPALEKIGDFDQPDFVAQPPGSDDLYVVERPGRLRIVREDRALSQPALDLTDQVAEEGEQGLLSVAFAPDFADSRLLYVYFTGNDGNQNVVEYRARDDGTVDPASARRVLEMDDFASNHNGGLLLFGPDGHLYIGTGDGGIADDPERNGQDLGSLLGKILRIDPQASGGKPYSVPADNPFAGRPDARPEICDYGLRNPWRFSFDRKTGSLIIGDVGQNTQEEIDFRPAAQVCGANFGWSAFEGTNRFNSDQRAPGAVEPIFTYGRDRGCSVTGGYVLRDPSLPDLGGRYLYSDYCDGDLRILIPASPNAKADRSLGLHVNSPVSFGEDTAGRIYVVSLEGPVYRLAR